MTWWKFWEKGTGGGRPDYYEEGVALVRQEAFHEALTSFRLALKEAPDDAATHEQMAVAYTHIGLMEEAGRAYRAAIQLRPRSPSAHYGLAFILLKEGRSGDAAGHLRDFLDLAQPDREDERQIEHARRTLTKLIPSDDGE